MSECVSEQVEQLIKLKHILFVQVHACSWCDVWFFTSNNYNNNYKFRC